jgi:hypothetical protein
MPRWADCYSVVTVFFKQDNYSVCQTIGLLDLLQTFRQPHLDKTGALRPSGALPDQEKPASRQENPL